MKQKYEYKFVRIGEGWLRSRFSAELEYQAEIRQHAKEGWRLVQVFAPSVGSLGASKYYELILEREMET